MRFIAVVVLFGVLADPIVLFAQAPRSFGGPPMGGGGARPVPGGGGGAPRPQPGGVQRPQPGVNRPQYGGGAPPPPYGINDPATGRPRTGNGPGNFYYNDPYGPVTPRPDVFIPGNPSRSAPPSGWQVHNPWANQSRILPSTGRIDLSHSQVTIHRGKVNVELQNVSNFARQGRTAEVNDYLSRQLMRTDKNLGAMMDTVNGLYGIQNSKYQELRTQTLGLAREQIAQGVKEPTPWVVVAQMSLQNDDAKQFNDATRHLMQQYPQSEYSHYFQGIQQLQNRDYQAAQQSLEKARELGMPEESIAELLKTAIDNQKWIWQYAGILSIVVVVWLLGLAILYLLGRRFSQRTLAGLAQDPRSLTDADRRLRKWYRRTIDFAGYYYYASLPVVVIVAIGLPLACAYAVLSVPYLNLPLLVVVALLGVGGIITAVSGIRTAFVREPKLNAGIPITDRQLPAIWTLVREVAAKVGTRPVDEIRLTAGTDLAVYEEGSSLERIRDRGRRVLILGIGTLDGLKLESLRAVLAHEYGHFQNRDTAGGDVALRVYQAMDRFALAIVMRGPVRKWDVAVHFLRFYHFIFRRLTFGASRLQEVLADVAAVTHYGADAFREGLTHVVRRSIEWDWAVDQSLIAAIRDERPTANLYQRMRLPNLSEREDLETALAMILNRATDADDTHPSPQNRFQLAERIDPVRRDVPIDNSASLLESDAALMTELNQLFGRSLDEQAGVALQQYRDGILFLSEHLSRGPNAHAFYERARLYIDKAEYEKALADLNSLLKLEPSAGAIFFLRATVLEKLGRYEAAVSDLVRAEGLESRDETAEPGITAEEKDRRQYVMLLKVAQCWAAAGRHEAALQAFARVLEKRTASLAALIGRGRSQRALNRLDAALADFQSAAELWPTSPEPLLERAGVFDALGRTEEAERDRRAAASIDRRVVDAAKQSASESFVIIEH